MLAPICIFAYNRLFETQQTVESLKNNYLASESYLFIFSDGPKDEKTSVKVKSVREYLHAISGFKSVEIIESPINKGLANSIIDGVTHIIEKYGKVIVLEDDLVTSPNFLDFMNQGLDFYGHDQNIFNINGYSMDLKSLNGYAKDYYLAYRASSWGWGTWKDRWENIDWDVKDYNTFIWNPIEHLKFMRGGSDMPYMLWKQMNGKIDSWAIRWCYHQFKNKQLSVVASQSKIINMGFGEQATHTKKTKRFKTKPDDGTTRDFIFNTSYEIDRCLIKEFRQQYSVFKRIKDCL